MIKLVSATKKYTPNNGKPVCALNDVDLFLGEKGLVCILGKSGSGKTTLLNIIGALDSLTNGYIEYNGKKLAEYSATDFDEYRNEHIAYIFQEYNLIADYNVVENIKIALRFQQTDEKKIQNRALEVLAEVGLNGYANRKIKELSGGQQQRVAIARAIAKNAKVLLCDEPTGNLDSETTCEIMKLLKKISNDRLVIMVTHDQDLASVFGDRILSITDGKLTEEIVINQKGNEEEHKPNDTQKQKKKRCALSFLNVVKYALGNVKNGILASSIVTCVLAISFTFLISFYSLSNFEQSKAIYNTLTVNETYVLPVTRYVDKVFLIEDDKSYAFGPSIECESVTETDYAQIMETLDKNAVIYSSYFFTKYFTDFADYNKDFALSNFQTNCFSEFVGVNDFDTFKMPLYKGRYPTAGSEVLIYDYMAYNMLKYDTFENIDTLDDFVEYDLVDKNTGFAMKVVGLIKSNYSDYFYIDDEAGNFDFETSYLSGLQSIFGLESFLPSIKDERKWYSISSGFFFEEMDDFGNGIPLSEVTRQPLYMIEDVSRYQFIGEFNPYDDYIGIVISQQQFAELYNIPLEDVDASIVNKKIGTLTMEIDSTLFTKAIEKTYAFDSLVGVIGVYSGEKADSILCYQKGDLEAEWFIPNGDFRQFFISLQNNEAENLEYITKLQPVIMEEEFYMKNLDYYKEGFMLYTPYLYIIEEANDYLIGVQKLGEKLTIVAVVLFIVGIVSYGFISIKKNRYKIGIFKSLGARNGDIVVIFCAEFFVIILISILISIFGARALVDMINQDFVQNLQYPIVFFRVVFTDYAYPISLGLVLAIISTLVPLIKLFCTQPITIIKNSRV